VVAAKPLTPPQEGPYAPPPIQELQLVSSTTRDLLEGSALVLEEAGTHELIGLSGKSRVFRVVVTPG
jgi:hypothetical protein